MKNYSQKRVDKDIQESVQFRTRNKKILDEVKKVTYKDLPTVLKELDRDLVRGALQGERFEELFFANCKCETLAECVREMLKED